MKYTKDFEKWLSCVERPHAMLLNQWHADQIKRFAWSAWQASRRSIRKPNMKHTGEQPAKETT